jgi:hypothetical protein
LKIPRTKQMPQNTAIMVSVIFITTFWKPLLLKKHLSALVQLTPKNADVRSALRSEWWDEMH